MKWERKKFFFFFLEIKRNWHFTLNLKKWPYPLTQHHNTIKIFPWVFSSSEYPSQYMQMGQNFPHTVDPIQKLPNRKNIK